MPRTITIYTQPTCQPCKATKRWWDKRGIHYQEVDIESECPDRLGILGAGGDKEAPVVIVSNGDAETDLMWSGFDPNNLTKYTTTEAAA